MLMFVMYTVKDRFLHMPSSCTFVMFDLGENSMKGLIDMIQKLVNHFNCPLILPPFHSFYAIRTLTTLGSISEDKTPVIDLAVKSNSKIAPERNEPQSWRSIYKHGKSSGNTYLWRVPQILWNQKHFSLKAPILSWISCFLFLTLGARSWANMTELKAYS